MTAIIAQPKRHWSLNTSDERGVCRIVIYPSPWLRGAVTKTGTIYGDCKVSEVAADIRRTLLGEDSDITAIGRGQWANPATEMVSNLRKDRIGGVTVQVHAVGFPGSKFKKGNISRCVTIGPTNVGTTWNRLMDLYKPLDTAGETI